MDFHDDVVSELFDHGGDRFSLVDVGVHCHTHLSEGFAEILIPGVVGPQAAATSQGCQVGEPGHVAEEVVDLSNFVAVLHGRGVFVNLDLGFGGASGSQADRGVFLFAVEGFLNLFQKEAMVADVHGNGNGAHGVCDFFGDGYDHSSVGAGGDLDHQ